jgi:ABC-type branched-subunit amino acid transport system ATPase component
MLEIEQLGVAYGKHEALRGVSLRVEPGRTVVILGANGAGKTTLLNAIAGVVRPLPGAHITFDGQPIQDEAPHRIVERGIALVPEGRRLFGDLSVIENLRLGAYPKRARAGEAKALDRMLAMFPRLAERPDQLARTMSGGEQQMLAIARALMSEPRLLLLDEPSLGLSPRLTKELFASLAGIAGQGQSILLVEQAVHLSLRLADWCYVLENGAITRSGAAAELRDEETLRRSYLGH